MTSKTERTVDSKNRRLGLNFTTIRVNSSVVDGVVVTEPAAISFNSKRFDLDDGTSDSNIKETVDLAKAVEFGIISEEQALRMVEDNRQLYRGMDYYNEMIAGNVEE